MTNTFPVNNVVLSTKKDNEMKTPIPKTYYEKKKIILSRVKQRPFKNEEISIEKIKKDYEKYKVLPKT